MRSTRRTPAQKTPIAGRSFSRATLLLLLVLNSSARAETLSEADVVRRVHATDPAVIAARAEVATAEAEVAATGRPPNPGVGWERESIPGVGTEDSLTLTVPLDLGGRRTAERAFAKLDAARAQARVAQTRSAAVALAVGVFYEALAADREVTIDEAAVARLEVAAQAVQRRHEEGTTSGYERARLELELELAKSDLRQARARARGRRVELAALLGVDAGALKLHGSLTRSGGAAEHTASERPSLRALRRAEAEAGSADDAASKAWVPELSLTGGLRIAQGDETRFGYVAGLSLALPVFTPPSLLAARAAAERERAAAQRRAVERDARVAEAGAREQWSATKAEIATLETATSTRVDLLERAVQSGYREGDRSVAELVDAQAARSRVERRRLALELAHKQAELRLRAARGEFE